MSRNLFARIGFFSPPELADPPWNILGGGLMSRREAVLYFVIGIAMILMLGALASTCDVRSRAWLTAAIGLASATAWAVSACVFRQAKLAARISFLAAALSGAACAVAVVPNVAGPEQISVIAAWLPARSHVHPFLRKENEGKHTATAPRSD
jgi:hypothetical protein